MQARLKCSSSVAQVYAKCSLTATRSEKPRSAARRTTAKSGFRLGQRCLAAPRETALRGAALRHEEQRA
eukprot:9210775-Pyramimonas_sp.AAC.1